MWYIVNLSILELLRETYKLPALVREICNIGNVNL